MTLSLIVAADQNNVIGANGKLLWQLPDDMKHFRSVTRGHPVIMGRKTFDSIGRPLPERRNIVISRQKALEIPGCEVVTSLDEALRLVEHDSSDEVFVIGGGEIYRQAMPHADRIYLTRVHGEFMGDTFFPEMDEGEWKEVSREERGIDERHTVSRAFIVLDRKK